MTGHNEKHEGKPTTSTFEGKPTTSTFEGKPTTSTFEGKPTTSTFEGDPPDEELRLVKAVARYQAAGHAVQSGIAHAIERGWNGTTPKHMRTGIDLGKADMEGLATLLISKGLITEVEYHEAVADAVEREKKRWEEFVGNLMGAPGKVTLG